MKGWAVIVGILILGMIISSGCTQQNVVKPITPLPAQETTIIITPTITSPIKDSDVATNTAMYTNDPRELQKKYKIYGTCSEVSRAFMKILEEYNIYGCSSPKSKQIENTHCFYNGNYIDNEMITDLITITEYICEKAPFSH
jgi:hypothetical protein